MIDMKIIGRNIRRERKYQMLTIEQLAEKADITDNFLGKIERGEGMPSLPTMDSIACALGVSIDSLKGNPEQDPQYQFVTSLVEQNNLTPENRRRYLEFITANIKYFK